MDQGNGTTEQGRAAPIGEPVLLSVLTIAGTASTFAPWLGSGSATRTSYETLRSAERLGLLDGGGHQLARALWAFLPLVGVGALAAFAFGRTRLGAVVDLLLGAALLGLALLIKNASQPAEWGATAGATVGIALLLGAGVTLSLQRTSP